MRRIVALLSVAVLLICSVVVQEIGLRRSVDYFGSGYGYRTAPEVDAVESAFGTGFRASLQSVEEKTPADDEDYPPGSRLVIATVRLTAIREITEGMTCRWAVHDAGGRIWQSLGDPCARNTATVPAGSVRELDVTFLVAGDATAPYKVVARPVLFARQ